MASAYEIENPGGTYFLTFTVVDWVDVFTRKCYRDIITDSFSFCRKEKGLMVWGYAIMTNHVHCILSARNENLPAVLRDFKRHTASKILELIHSPTESRRDWLLKRFEFAARSSARSGQYKFWMRDNHAMELTSSKFINQKLNYIHMNPVNAGWVEKAEDWLYSSARNYVLKEGIIEIDLID